MLRSSLILSCLVFMIIFNVKGIDAPKVQAGIILNATVAPATTIVPVTVTNFVDIGSYKLTLDYDTNSLTYSGISPNAAFSGVTVSVSIPGGMFYYRKRLTITWPASGSGITLPDQAVLLNISFTYKVSGNTGMMEWYNNGNTCQFTKYAGGAYTTLTDLPTSSFYFNGVVTNHPAPVTIAPVITSATPGTVLVPIMVNQLTNVGSITLQLEYDTTVLTYQNIFTKNPLIPGAFSIGSNLYSGKIKTINIGYYIGTFSLPDNSTMLTLYFTYTNTGTAKHSELNWTNTYGPECEYVDGQYRVLYDGQYSVFLKHGLVASQLSPKTWLPSITDAVPSENVTVPVKVLDFNNIRSFTLSFKYDPAAMTYNSATPNATFGGALSVVNNPAGGDGKRTLVISWTGTSSKTLANYSSLVDLDFTYNTGTSALAWVTDDATSCRFNDATGYAFYDKPKTTYYQDGLVSSQLAPRTAAWYASPTAGQQVTVPVKVYDFSNIGLVSLTMDYDPGALTFQSASLVPSIGGTFNASTSGAGRLLLNWSGTATSLTDGSTLINLTFTYNSGESTLSWFDDGSSCRYAAGVAAPVLYDSPQAQYYINGYIGPNPLTANFMASDTIPLANTTITLTDLSTGGPTAWQWIISPSTYIYVNGTTSTSQNPQVQFTANGAYSITLITSRGALSAINARPDYIYAGIPGLWTGITSSDWFTASNWHNYRVPLATTDVLIPSSAPHWPVFTGIFTVGTHCRNITLQGGGNALMTIIE